MNIGDLRVVGSIQIGVCAVNVGAYVSFGVCYVCVLRCYGGGLSVVGVCEVLNRKRYLGCL